MEQIEKISENFDFVVIHQDADSHEELDVIDHKWIPWMSQCKHPHRWIPLIPVHMTDTWMLADRESLCEILDVDPQKYNSLVQGRKLETISDSKNILEDVIAASSDWDMSDLYDLLPKQMSIDFLARLNAFNKFYERLCSALNILEKS